MYIKSILIDGFKSYGGQIEVHGFDPEFTVITGFECIKSSDILDSIRFVLDIMNLGQTTSTSLKHLIYQNGQADITKTTVTLIFDNTNPSQCPVGYEKCREISVRREFSLDGKDKYLINGRTVHRKRLAKFFTSIRLNIENPNFLIRNECITKVLNKKPTEILAIIETAAGINILETKRETATKLIEKKDAKILEINTLLRNEIEPKLENLRREKSAYMEFQKICRDIECLTRIHISFSYLKYKEALKSTEVNREKLSAEIDAARQRIAENEKERKEIKENFKELKKIIDQTKGEEMKEIKVKLECELGNKGIVEGNLKTNQNIIDQEEKKLKSIVKMMEDDEKSLQLKGKEMNKLKKIFQNLKKIDSADTLAYEDARKKYEIVMREISTNQDGCSLQDQAKTEITIMSQMKIKDIDDNLPDVKSELKKAAEAMKKANLKAKKSRNNWKKHKQECNILSIEIKSLQRDITHAKEQRSSLESKLAKLKAEQQDLRNKNATATAKITELRRKVNEQKDKIYSQNKELRCVYNKLKQVEERHKELHLEIKGKESEPYKVGSDSKDLLQKMKNLSTKYPWINEDEEYFGMRNSRYDYCKEDPIEAAHKLIAMNEQKDQMEHSINPRATILLAREGRNYQKFIRRQKIIEQDISKMKNVICKMDESKREKVEKAWMVMDGNLNNIFSTLLQGAQARLNPVKDNDQLTGLEIKVGFNGIWKESLDELSDTERPLVALSFLLALLKFSPTPLCILDEISAALDTQNISNILKAHFTSSQLIIFPLKQGSSINRRTQGEVFTNAIELAEEEIEDSSDNTFASALYRSPTVENTDLISVEDDTPLLSFEDESQPIEHYPINKKKNSESVKYVDNFLESYIAEDSTEEAKEANELHTMTTKTLSEKNLLTKSGKDAVRT
ncbi:structural maintenance of chromosomes protein 2-like [Glossina fuscipes]|uniref:Structural maintenance of chromosomes protein 2-like n=1 Tax=Glossina fuscipes TaxID=7396 RepID=A0A9C5Z6Q3_9MUSC|nr:structural maintenance of chromosomes protein 2-like [Glossina fuscipes]